MNVFKTVSLIAVFLIDGSGANPNENALSDEIRDVALDFDQEEFLHIADDRLETQQTHDSAISMVENEGEKDQGRRHRRKPRRTRKSGKRL